MFAKIFDSTPYGQILVRVERDDEGAPAVHWSVCPPGLSVCTVTLSFEDSETGWDQAEAALETADIAQAEEFAKNLFAQVQSFAGEAVHD